jgi:glycerol-3-phosphate acyltransferase PlsX
MAAAPASAVRAQSDATVRVAIRALAAGDADAVVTLGSSGAAVTSAVLDLGLLPGVERPALAVVIPSASGPLVLLDVGANVRVDPALLVNHAMLGAAFAHGVLGLEAPRVGLLSNGLEPGKGGAQRVEAAAALAVLCAELSGSVPSVRFIGNVEGHHVPLGGLADVVVTDGMIGNVLLKGMEGTWELLRKTDAIMEDSLGQTARSALLLGVAGLVVVGHGAARGTDVAACIHTAATAVRENWFHHFRAVQTDLSSRADSLNRA